MASCFYLHLYIYTFAMSLSPTISYLACTAPTTRGGEEFFDYIMKQIKLAGMTRASLARRLGLANNAVFLWERRRRIPINHVVQIAKLLGLDPIYLRNMALKEWTPELFEDDERLRRFAEMTTNELDFLEIIRTAGKRNPRMNEEQKKEFAKFVASLDGDEITQTYDDPQRPGRRSNKKIENVTKKATKKDADVAS